MATQMMETNGTIESTATATVNVTASDDARGDVTGSSKRKLSETETPSRRCLRKSERIASAGPRDYSQYGKSSPDTDCQESDDDLFTVINVHRCKPSEIKGNLVNNDTSVKATESASSGKRIKRQRLKTERGRNAAKPQQTVLVEPADSSCEENDATASDASPKFVPMPEGCALYSTKYVTKLKKRLDRARNKNVEYQREHDQLKSENDRLQKALQQKIQEMAKSKSQITKLEGQQLLHNKLKKKVEQLQQELLNLGREKTQLEKIDSQNAEANKKKVEEELSQLKSENKRLTEVKKKITEFMGNMESCSQFKPDSSCTFEADTEKYLLALLDHVKQKEELARDLSEEAVEKRNLVSKFKINYMALGRKRATKESGEMSSTVNPRTNSSYSSVCQSSKKEIDHVPM